MKESAVYIRMRQKVQVVLEQPVTLGTVAQIVAPPALQKSCKCWSFTR